MLGVAVALILVVVVAVRYRAADSPVRRADGDRAAPSFAVEDLRDESSTITLAGLRGRPVVLNFWASWCVPCRKELPAFQAVYRRMGGEVAFLGINHQDGRVDALKLLRDMGVRYPSGFDPGGEVAQAYGLYGMPTTVFVSAEGRIVATRTGEMSASQLTEAIRDLFSVRVFD